MPELLTIVEVADILRVSRETVRLMCVDGDLPAFRARGSWRIRRDALAEYMQVSA